MTLRQFRYFTAVTLPACALLMLFGDQPLARFIHAHAAGGAPFFNGLTAGADAGHEALMTHIIGLPIIFLGWGWPLPSAATP